LTADVFGLSGLFRAADHLNQTNEINQRNQIDQIAATRREMVPASISLSEK